MAAESDFLKNDTPRSVEAEEHLVKSRIDRWEGISLLKNIYEWEYLYPQMGYEAILSSTGMQFQIYKSK